MQKASLLKANYFQMMKRSKIIHAIEENTKNNHPPPWCFANSECTKPIGRLSSALEGGGRTHLLSVVGHVGQHGGHVEHDFIVFVCGVQGVSSCRISWKQRWRTKTSQATAKVSNGTLTRSFFQRQFNLQTDHPTLNHQCVLAVTLLSRCALFPPFSNARLWPEGLGIFSFALTQGLPPCPFLNTLAFEILTSRTRHGCGGAQGSRGGQKLEAQLGAGVGAIIWRVRAN